MSRLVCKDEDQNTVNYGLDDDLGWYYEVYDSCDHIIEERSSLYDDLTRGELVDFLNNTIAPQQCITFIALDLDPALAGAS